MICIMFCELFYFAFSSFAVEAELWSISLDRRQEKSCVADASRQMKSVSYSEEERHFVFQVVKQTPQTPFILEPPNFIT